MAAPHTLQLDHLKLSSCCSIEGQGLKDCLEFATACIELLLCCMALAAGMLHNLLYWYVARCRIAQHLPCYAA